MKRHRNLLLASLVASGLAAAGLAETGSGEETILALEREWLSRFGQGDVDWIVAAHAPDAQQFPPNAPPVVGIDALRALIARFDSRFVSSSPIDSVKAHLELGRRLGRAGLRGVFDAPQPRRPPRATGLSTSDVPA